jgi:hypothetical protein
MILLATLCLVSTIAPVRAQSPTESLQRIRAAERALEIAELELRRYERVEYPLRLRQLESRIKLAKVRVSMHERLIAEYERFTKNAYSSPLIFSLELERVALAEAKLSLDDLDEERRLTERYHTDHCRLYELKVEAAQQYLDSLQPRR